MRIKAPRTTFGIRTMQGLWRLWLATMLLLSMSALFGCAHGPTRTQMREIAGPDTDGILRLSTRFSFAHGCPVSPNLALTSGHVIDPFPLDPNASQLGGGWTTKHGDRGRVYPLVSISTRDLGVIRAASGEFPKWFQIATKAPTPGLPVYVLGYDFRDSKRAFEDRVHKLEVLRIVGGHVLLLDTCGEKDHIDTQPGSSGSCVLNTAGEVVGVIDGGMTMDNADRVSLAVGIWGEKLEDLVPPRLLEERP